MKYVLSLILALAAGVSAAALPVRVARSTPQVFNVTDFYVGGSPFSLYTDFEFQATDGTSSVSCSALNNVYPGPGPLPVTVCGNSTWEFSFPAVSEPADGYNFCLNNTASNEGGCKFYPESDVIYNQDPSGNPNGNYYSLSSPSQFLLPYTVSA